MTLKAMFKLFDGYSSTVDKIEKKTDKATNKILNASGATDKFNRKLEATGTSANKGSAGLSKFLSIAAMITGAVKGANISDTYMNTAARLDLINDGLQTQAELQDKIFASANRAKGSYTSMASAISKMGLLAGDSFSSNDELIGFTELLQKSFKVSGASTGEQDSAMLQLSQAMAAGKLQGDEFRSIMENAPMLADAIAKYTGKTKGQLKEMSAEGTITADIIKNALFSAGEDINAKFEEMPYTFADIWNKIKNGGINAFSGLIEKINKLINTDQFMAFVDKLIVGFSLAADAAGWLIDAIIAGWDVIGPILGIIAIVYLTSMIVKLASMVPLWAANAAGVLSVVWPILLIIGLIAIAISAAHQLGASWEQIFGFIGGVIGTLVAFFYNQFAELWNFIAAFVNFFGNVFRDPATAIKVLILDMANAVLGYIETIAQAIEDMINSIPGVEVDITSGLDNFRNKISDATKIIKEESGYVTYAKTLDYMDYSEGAAKGYKMGADITNRIGSVFDSLTHKLSDEGTSYNPTVVEGTGSKGNVKVSMDKEDIGYLRDLAEREFVNKFSTATLAPKITVKFTGAISKETDTDAMYSRIGRILQEQIAVAAEGVYG